MDEGGQAIVASCSRALRTVRTCRIRLSWMVAFQELEERSWVKSSFLISERSTCVRQVSYIVGEDITSYNGVSGCERGLCSAVFLMPKRGASRRTTLSLTW